VRLFRKALLLIVRHFCFSKAPLRHLEPDAADLDVAAGREALGRGGGEEERRRRGGGEEEEEEEEEEESTIYLNTGYE